MTLGMIKYFAVFMLMMGLAWGSYWVVHAGIYPVAMVNQKFIWAKEFKTTYQSALVFYSQVKNPDIDQPIFEKEIRRASLDKLVENYLVFEAVNKVDVKNQLANLIKQNPNLEKGSTLTYGLPWDDFQDLVLRPQIAVEILQKNLESENKNITEWTQDKKEVAHVRVFLNDLDWQDGQVVAR